MRTSENNRFSDVFRGHRNVTLNSNGLISQEINFFYNRSNICPLPQKICGSFQRGSFKIHPLFTKYLQVWGVAEVCGISDIFHFSNMSVKY